MDEMTVKALAKINIGLDVTGVREDGYHLVRMIMQTVHMYDLVTVSKSAETGISMTSNAKYLPTNEDNLCIKAAKLLADEFSITDGTQIRLSKRIPVAAGMAGGSSDAAAVLYGMNRIHGLGLTNKELMERGVKIGAVDRTSPDDALSGFDRKTAHLCFYQVCLRASGCDRGSGAPGHRCHDRRYYSGRPACVGIPYGQYLRGCDYSEISGDRTDQGVDAAEWSRGFHDERQWSDRLWFF